MFRRRDRLPLHAQLREAFYPRRGWRRAAEYIGHRVRRLPDTPHRIALGLAVGVALAWTPFFGLHFLLAAALAWLVRGNLLAALIGTFALNPVTLPVIAPVSVGLGRRVLGHDPGDDSDGIVEALGEATAALWSGLRAPGAIGEVALPRLVPLFTEIFWPYLIGGLLPGLVSGIASYYLLRPLIGAYQTRRRTVMLERARVRIHAAHEDGAPGRRREE